MKTSTNISNNCPVCGNEKIWEESVAYDDGFDHSWTCPCGAHGEDHCEIVFEKSVYETPSSDQLMAFFEKKYGENWERAVLTETEDRAWIEALYEWYEKEVPQHPGYYVDDEEDEWYGKPFEIVRRVDYDDEDYDICALPLWIVRIGDHEFAAHCDEIFDEPPASEQGIFAKESKQGYPVIYRNGTDCVLFRASCPELPYVVAFGYDVKTGEWNHGNYLDDLQEAIFKAEGGVRSVEHVLNENGNLVMYRAAVAIMDDDLREELHRQLAPCSDQRFFEAYAEAHEMKFGEPFAPWVGGDW